MENFFLEIVSKLHSYVGRWGAEKGKDKVIEHLGDNKESR